jgi:repressor LexA
MSIGLTIKERRKDLGLTQVQLGEKVFKSAQVISNWERGYTTGITAEDIKNLSSALKIPSKDLIEENPLVEKINLYELKDTKRVPVIGTVRCGAGGVAYEYIDEYITVDDTYRPDEMRGFRAEGDSMEPEIHDGDICLVHLQEEVPDGALAVVVICDGVEEAEGTIKRIHKADGAVILQATNPAYPPRIFTGEKANRVKIVGRVVEIRHKTI